MPRHIGPVGLARAGDFFIQPAKPPVASLGFFLRSRTTTTWAANTAKARGNRVIATSTTAFLGIHFECVAAGTTDASTEPTWNTTVGGTTTEASGTIVWMTRGSAKAWVASATYAVGDRVLKTTRVPVNFNNASSAIWECTIAGAANSTEPTWPTTITANVTTIAEVGTGTATWTARAAKSWDNAHPFLNAMLSDITNTTMRVAAGDTVFVSKNHNETTINDYTITMPGTRTNPCRVLCVDDNDDPASPTTLATTAVLAATFSVSAGSLTFSSSNSYWYGITFSSASGASSPIPQIGRGQYFEACQHKIAGTGSSGLFLFGTSTGGQGEDTVFDNTTFSFGNVANLIEPRSGRYVWKNTASALVGSVPTVLFGKGSGTNTVSGRMTVRGVDLSAMGAGKSLVDVTPIDSWQFLFEGCRLGSSVNISSGTHIGIGGRSIELVNCDSADTNYRTYRETYGGTLVHETSVVRTGGASDGTQQLSWKMVSNANTVFRFPLESFPIIAWNDTASGSVTATVEFVHDGIPLNTDEIWAEIEYMGTASLPLTLFSNNAKANVLANGVAQPTSTVTWAGTGGFTNVIKQNLAITFSPVKKGPVTVTVYVAKASKIVFIDPLIALS